MKYANLTAYFFGMILGAGALFFFSAILTDPFKKIVQMLNDPLVQKSGKDWVLFVASSSLTGLMWGGAWLWFKNCEKKFLDLWNK